MEKESEGASKVRGSYVDGQLPVVVSKPNMRKMFPGNELTFGPSILLISLPYQAWTK